MSKSNYDIKMGHNVVKPRILPSGFLLVELMMAVFIGLILISSLMRMQSILLELQDSFYMRGTALSLALECLECRDLNGKSEKSGVYGHKGRDFRLNFDQHSLGQDSANNKLITKVKVEWRSLVGKNCCLEI